MREGCTLWICTHASDEQFLLKGSEIEIAAVLVSAMLGAKRRMRKMLRDADAAEASAWNEAGSRRPRAGPLHRHRLDQILLADKSLHVEAVRLQKPSACIRAVAEN